MNTRNKGHNLRRDSSAGQNRGVSNLTVDVLVTAVGTTTAVSVIKGLRKQHEFDIRVVGTDINTNHDIAGSRFCDSFFTVPKASRENQFIAALAGIARDESIDLLIPVFDAEIEVISRRRNAFPKKTFLLLSPHNTVTTCNDKLKTLNFFNGAGIPTLKTYAASNVEEFGDLVKKGNLSLPCIVKPRRGVGSKDVYEVRTKDELCLIDRVEEPIVQEMGKGIEYTIDIFCAQGRPVAIVPRRRIETKAGISYKGETSRDPDLVRYAKRIASALPIVGPANFQCFKDGRDVRFFEINPRFSGGLPLTIAAGMNTPHMALKLATGMGLRPKSRFKTVRMCRYWEEVFYEGG